MNIMRNLQLCLILIIIGCNNNELGKSKPKNEDKLNNKPLINLPESSLKKALEIANNKKTTSPEQQQPLPETNAHTTNQQGVTQKENGTSPVDNKNGNSENKPNIISTPETTSSTPISVINNSQILPPTTSPQSPPLDLANHNSDLDTWSKTFFEQCNNKHKLSIACNRLNYLTPDAYTILSDKNKIIDEFKDTINIIAKSYKDNWDETDYDTKEKTIDIHNEKLDRTLLAHNSQQDVVRNHVFDPVNYPGLSTTQFLERHLNITIDGYSISNLYFSLNYDQDYIYPLIKAMGYIVKQWPDLNHESKKICRTLLRSMAWMAARIQLPLYTKWYKNSNFLNKFTIEEIFALSAGLGVQWSRRQVVLDNIKKNISFLLSKQDSTAQDFLNLFKIFNQPGSMWNQEFKRRDIESKYLLSKYYHL